MKAAASRLGRHTDPSTVAAMPAFVKRNFTFSRREVTRPARRVVLRFDGSCADPHLAVRHQVNCTVNQRTRSPPKPNSSNARMMSGNDRIELLIVNRRSVTGAMGQTGMVSNSR